MSRLIQRVLRGFVLEGDVNYMRKGRRGVEWI